MERPQSEMVMPRIGPVTDWAPRAVPRDDAIGVLFRAHAPGLLRLAHCLLGDRESAEDAVQEAYVSLYRHWDRLREEGAAHAYLRAAVVNRCRSGQGQLVRARAIRRRLVEVERPVPSSEASVIRGEDELRLADAVRALPRRQREVVVCRYYLELSEAETAALLEIGVGSVKRHAHRGLTRLGQRLGGRR